MSKYHVVRKASAKYKVVFIRHGESEYNEMNRFTGWQDVNLTPTGVSQA